MTLEYVGLAILYLLGLFVTCWLCGRFGGSDLSDAEDAPVYICAIFWPLAVPLFGLGFIARHIVENGAGHKR